MRKKYLFVAFFLCTAAAVFLMAEYLPDRFYRLWLWLPAAAASLFTGDACGYRPGYGYFFPESGAAITPACSGLTIIAVCIAAAALLYVIRSSRFSVGGGFLCVFTGAAAGLAANLIRVTVAVFRISLVGNIRYVHMVGGVVVYVSAMFILSFVIEKTVIYLEGKNV